MAWNGIFIVKYKKSYVKLLIILLQLEIILTLVRL